MTVYGEQAQLHALLTPAKVHMVCLTLRPVYTDEKPNIIIDQENITSCLESLISKCSSGLKICTKLSGKL